MTDALFKLSFHELTKPSSFFKQRQLECYKSPGSPTKIDKQYQNLVPSRWMPSGWKYTDEIAQRIDPHLRKSENLTEKDSYFSTSYDETYSPIPVLTNKKLNPRVFDPSISRYKVRNRVNHSPIPHGSRTLHQLLESVKNKPYHSQKPQKTHRKDREIRWAGVMIKNRPTIFNKKKAEFTEFVDNISKFISN